MGFGNYRRGASRFLSLLALSVWGFLPPHAIVSSILTGTATRGEARESEQHEGGKAHLLEALRRETLFGFAPWLPVWRPGSGFPTRREDARDGTRRRGHAGTPRSHLQ